MHLEDAVAQHRDGPVIQPLHPGLRPVLRTDGTLQLGQDPVHGVLLTGLAVHETRAVSRLLGIVAGAAAPLRVEALARSTGLPVARVQQIADTLEQAGLTRPGTPVLPSGGIGAWSLARLRHGREELLGGQDASSLTERRAGALVTIDGRGSLAGDIARLLTSARVGQIRSGWYASASEDLDRTSPDPCLIITVGTLLPRSRAAGWLARGIAHLPVTAGTASVDIGPLIVPGSGPCLECIARQDGAAPRAGLEGHDPVTDGQSETVHVEPALAALAAGAAAMLTLGHIDAYPPPLGVRWHCALPLPSLATSRWRIHPECDSASHRVLPVLVDSGPMTSRRRTG